jgi:hypothetical protein
MKKLFNNFIDYIVLILFVLAVSLVIKGLNDDSDITE